ncbi:hypothetical protein TorRG33x02_033770, partial [Trema orientale]
PYNSHKLAFRSSKCLFLGYSSAHKGYMCLHPTGRVYISHNVVFNELDFPYSELFQHKPAPSSSVGSSSSISTTFQSNNDTGSWKAIQFGTLPVGEACPSIPMSSPPPSGVSHTLADSVP